MMSVHTAHDNIIDSSIHTLINQVKHDIGI